jgi:hypothetical protein
MGSSFMICEAVNDGEVGIVSDGTVVWVNRSTGCIGRFGKNGIDVHSVDTSTCLHCTHERATKKNWEVFKEKMLEHHLVVVTNIHKPERF